MSSRITQKTVSRTVMDGLQGNLARMQKLQEQLSSGKQMSRPSDSPVKTVEALQFRSTIRRTEQYVRNADDGLAQLGAADAALTDGLSLTRRVRDLVLTGMNDTVGPEGRAALAGEIDQTLWKTVSCAGCGQALCQAIGRYARLMYRGAIWIGQLETLTCEDCDTAFVPEKDADAEARILGPRETAAA